MQSIWKFGLEITDYQEIMMPVGAKILCVKNQNARPHIWAVCDTEAIYEKRSFRVYGTGQEYLDVYGDYIGTVQIYETMYAIHKQFVWHVFEVFGQVEAK